jgi:hypothetical protein
MLPVSRQAINAEVVSIQQIARSTAVAERQRLACPAPAGAAGHGLDRAGRAAAVPRL